MSKSLRNKMAKKMTRVANPPDKEIMPVPTAPKTTGNSKEQMRKNNRTMMEIDRHNRSWNGKKYTQ